jgi:hypothetical protein
MTTKTQFKTDIVERYKNGESSYKISEDEGCSYNAVLRELKRRGVNTGLKFWSKGEIAKLKRLYPVAYNEELLKEFPDRTKESICSIANKLGLMKRESEKICKGCGKKFTIKYRGRYKVKGFCPKCIKKQWEQNNRENAINRKRQWLLRNPEYLKQLRRESPKYRLDSNMGVAIYQALKERKGGRHWESLVDYTLKDLIKYLESQFDDKMNWENYGSYWHVDHIKPRSLFKYTFPEDPEFKECWALKNLQPLEKIANIRKHCKYTSNIFETKPS